MTRPFHRVGFPGRLVGCAVLVGLLAGCNVFRRSAGPDEAPPANPPRLVTVTIEYRQSQHCQLSPNPACDNPVVFFATWMRPPENGDNGILLTRDPGGFVWRGRAFNVPANFPPRDDPHAVRVVDPHLYGTETNGATAQRLKVGGQVLTFFDSFGTPYEEGLIYIDDNGQGRNPY